VSQVENVVVSVEVNAVQVTVPPVSGHLAGVIFEHVDNPAVFTVVVEVRVGRIEKEE
jgi:hypothetical protein